MRTTCLATRRDGFVIRRRRRTNFGEVFWTVEIPATVLTSAAYPPKVRKALASFERAMQRKQTKSEAERLLREGWKFAAIASQLGLSISAVQKYKQAMR